MAGTRASVPRTSRGRVELDRGPPGRVDDMGEVPLSLSGNGRLKLLRAVVLLPLLGSLEKPEFCGYISSFELEKAVAVVAGTCRPAYINGRGRSHEGAPSCTVRGARYTVNPVSEARDFKGGVMSENRNGGAAESNGCGGDGCADHGPDGEALNGSVRCGTESADATHGGTGAEGGSAEDALQEQVQELAEQLAEMRDRNLRLMADFENFKRRALKEQSELLKYQGERVIVDLLDVVDNLELALNHSSEGGAQLKAGLEMILKMFVERLGKWDVRGESAMGTQFDPQKHAAISRIPGAEVAPGTVVGELKKAYFYKDKLIRPGEVVVAVEASSAQS